MRTVERWVRLTTIAAAVAAGCGEEGRVPQPTEPSSVGAIALPDGLTIGGPPMQLGVADGPRFSGIALINLDGFTCSGSLVVPATLDLATDGPAYLLTAGHCLLTLGGPPNDIVGDTRLDPPTNSVRFRYFGDSTGAATEVGATRFLFATLKGADIGIVELAPTRLELRRAGVVPFVLSDEAGVDGEAIAYAGYPGSAGPFSPAVLGACRQLRKVPLVLEAGFHSYDAIANDCQGLLGGASGSPVLSLATGKVIGLHNTHAEEGGVPCAHNHPCEGGVNISEGTAYAIPTAGLGACFGPAGRFDVTLGGCPLDRDIQVEPLVSRVDLTAAPGGAIPFEVMLGARGLSHYRAAVVPAATGDCRDAGAYGPVLALAEAPSAAATVAGDPGIALLCLQAGLGPDPTGAGWQDARTPTVIQVAVAAPP